MNRERFVVEVGVGKKAEIIKAILNEARETFEGLGLCAFVCIGGDGSLSTALQLQKAGVPVVGVPKTIDNDLSATNMTFGFDSAVESVVDALDRLHATVRSHKRIMVVEAMGRMPVGFRCTAAWATGRMSSSSRRLLTGKRCSSTFCVGPTDSAAL